MEQQKKKMGTGKKILIGFVALTIIGMIGSYFDKKDKGDKSASSTSDSSSTEAVKPKIDIKERLTNSIADFDKPFNDSSFRGTILNVEMEVILFSTYASFINEGDSSSDPSIKKMATELKNKVSALQSKEFPKMRKEYCQIIANKLWENNIDVTIQGSSNNTINLTGAIYANNKNILESQKALIDDLTRLRFKEVRYRWYKDEDEFNFYKLETPKDNEVLKAD